MRFSLPLTILSILPSWCLAAGGSSSSDAAAAAAAAAADDNGGNGLRGRFVHLDERSDKPPFLKLEEEEVNSRRRMQTQCNVTIQECCLDEAFRANGGTGQLGCTAQDLDNAFGKLIGDPQECAPDTSISVNFDVFLELNSASDRSDIGVWINTEGGDAKFGDGNGFGCEHFYFPIPTQSDLPELDRNVSSRGLDYCGDIPGGTSVAQLPLYKRDGAVSSVTIKCTDSDNDEVVDVNICFAYAQPGDNDPLDCPDGVADDGTGGNEQIGTAPGTSSKCKCFTVNIANLTVTQDEASQSPSESPSETPTTDFPSESPSETPTTDFPSESPSETPTTDFPSESPSETPTTDFPSESPSETPTTDFPSESPSETPTTDFPSESPSETPTTDFPSESPSETPSNMPSETPSETPTTDFPSESPSETPSAMPSETPSNMPSETPSNVPSESPSETPSDMPSETPSNIPSETPSETPSNMPSEIPSQSPTETPCETAFGKGTDDNSQCFDEFDDIQNPTRWGWTNSITYTIGESYEFDLYAGAADCDTSKGALVGNATVEVDNVGDLIVTYHFKDFVDFLEDVHFYAGTEEFPTQTRGKNEVKTAAPGQYTYVNDDPTLTAQKFEFTLDADEIEGCPCTDGTTIYVILHTSVCSSLFNSIF